MAPFSTTLRASLFTLCVFANTHHNNMACPFGVTFSPTTIFTSRYTAMGSVEIMRHPASPEYRKYYYDTVDKFGQVQEIEELQNKARLIFQYDIAFVTKSLRKQLGHEPEFSTVFLPSVFDGNVIAAAAGILFPKTERITKAGPTQQAACLGFRFLEGMNLGRPIEDCNSDGPESFVLLLEYENEYLYASFMSVAFELGTYYVRHKQLCKDCGEGAHQVCVLFKFIVGRSLIQTQKTGSYAYQKRLKVFLEDFLNEQILQDQSKREDIRAIVISGEASPTGNAELGAIALEVVGTSVVKIMTEIESSETAAYGAAVWSNEIQQSPEGFRIHDGNRIVDEQYHAENEASYKSYLERRDEL
jgi:hypothetical protein